MMTTTKSARPARPARPAKSTPAAEPTRTPREELPASVDLFGGKKWPPAVKFETLHTPQQLFITDVQQTQARKYDPNGGQGELLTWPSGDPMMIAVVIGVHVESDEERALFVQGRKLTQAIRDAIHAANYTGMARGDLLTVEWTGEEEVIGANGEPVLTTHKGQKEPMLAKVYAATIE